MTSVSVFDPSFSFSPTGQFWAIEVKKPGGKPTNEQTAFLNRVRANGGMAILAYSIDDVLDKLGRSSSEMKS